MSFELGDTHEAIIRRPGHVLVTGGPGSGKTTIALLKAKALCPELKPGQGILFLSFSRAAIRQIVARSRSVLSRDERRRIDIKTYHLFCLEVLQGHGRLLKGRPLRFITPPCERLRKADFDGDWEAEQARLAREEGVYCFDRFAEGAAELFEGSEALLALYGDRFPLIIVDEFQDTDDDQWRLIRALSGGTGIVCLADPEQRIFDYRPTVSPQRIQTLRDALAPAEFDLGVANHRSPTAGILAFANCVLRNEGPLPTTADVKVVGYWPKAFASTVHAAVLWTFSELRRQGVEDPCVAVLTRSNRFVADLSAILLETHEFNKRSLRAVPHDVVWDADLAAASAEVVGSILEWSKEPTAAQVARTLEQLAQFFRMRNAEKPTKGAAQLASQLAAASQAIGKGRQPPIAAACAIVGVAADGMEFRGDPVVDWRRARDVLRCHKVLKEVLRSARMIRLFQASDVLSRALCELWLGSGGYAGASQRIRATLDQERLLSQERDPRGCVLMTMHKSKGKEFDGVVIVEGRYVSRFFDDEREKPPFERSRRLLRVGVTRARRLVTLVRPRDARQLVG